MIAYFNFLRKFKNYIILSLKRLAAFPPLLLRVLFVLIILFTQSNSSVTEAHNTIDCPPFCGNPPYTPSNPSPADGAIGINTNPTLSWSGGAPDGGPVNYDISLDTKNPPDNQVCGCKDTSFIPPTLEPGKTYYWYVFAWQSHYMPAFGPIWNFTTSFLNYLPLVILNE